MLSAILSSYNELHNAHFWSNLAMLRALAEVEVIVVDGGSDDGTREKLRANGVRVEELPLSNRAERYNVGIHLAAGNTILIVHPRSLLPADGVSHLRDTRRTSTWGAFRHSFDWPHPILSFTSWYSNKVRGRIRGIYYLDHCLYFTADLKGHARFPSVGIFEDTHFCRRLRGVAHPELLPYKVQTSAIRFRTNGVFRQSLMNQVLKVLFNLGVSESLMTRVYEKGLKLNGRQN